MENEIKPLGTEDVLKWLDNESSSGLDLSPGYPKAKEAARIIRDLQTELKRAHEIFENHVVDMRIALDCGSFPCIDAAYDLQAKNKRLIDALKKLGKHAEEGT